MKLGNKETQKKEFNILSDEQLVKMAQEGSGTAEEYLIDKYKELVKNKAHLYFIVGGDRDDVIQEGMIGIFKAIRSFDEDKKASFRTHVETCIKGQIFNAIKKANRLKNQPLNESLSIDGNEDNDFTIRIDELIDPNTQQNPETLLILKELMAFLMDDKKKKFSKMESQIFDLMIEGNDINEIAEKTNKSYKAVDNAMQRIKKKMLVYLKGYDKII